MSGLTLFCLVLMVNINLKCYVYCQESELGYTVTTELNEIVTNTNIYNVTVSIFNGADTTESTPDGSSFGSTLQPNITPDVSIEGVGRNKDPIDDNYSRQDFLTSVTTEVPDDSSSTTYDYITTKYVRDNNEVSTEDEQLNNFSRDFLDEDKHFTSLNYEESRAGNSENFNTSTEDSVVYTQYRDKVDNERFTTVMIVSEEFPNESLGDGIVKGEDDIKEIETSIDGVPIEETITNELSTTSVHFTGSDLDDTTSLDALTEMKSNTTIQRDHNIDNDVDIITDGLSLTTKEKAITYLIGDASDFKTILLDPRTTTITNLQEITTETIVNANPDNSTGAPNLLQQETSSYIGLIENGTTDSTNAVDETGNYYSELPSISVKSIETSSYRVQEESTFFAELTTSEVTEVPNSKDIDASSTSVMHVKGTINTETNVAVAEADMTKPIREENPTYVTGAPNSIQQETSSAIGFTETATTDFSNTVGGTGSHYTEYPSVSVEPETFEISSYRSESNSSNKFDTTQDTNYVSTVTMKEDQGTIFTPSEVTEVASSKDIDASSTSVTDEKNTTNTETGVVVTEDDMTTPIKQENPIYITGEETSSFTGFTENATTYSTNTVGEAGSHYTELPYVSVESETFETSSYKSQPNTSSKFDSTQDTNYVSTVTMKDQSTLFTELTPSDVTEVASSKDIDVSSTSVADEQNTINTETNVVVTEDDMTTPITQENPIFTKISSGTTIRPVTISEVMTEYTPVTKQLLEDSPILYKKLLENNSGNNVPFSHNEVTPLITEFSTGISTAEEITEYATVNKQLLEILSVVDEKMTVNNMTIPEDDVTSPITDVNPTFTQIGSRDTKIPVSVSEIDEKKQTLNISSILREAKTMNDFTQHGVTTPTEVTDDTSSNVNEMVTHLSASSLLETTKESNIATSDRTPFITEKDVTMEEQTYYSSSTDSHRVEPESNTSADITDINFNSSQEPIAFNTNTGTEYSFSTPSIISGDELTDFSEVNSKANDANEELTSVESIFGENFTDSSIGDIDEIIDITDIFSSTVDTETVSSFTEEQINSTGNNLGVEDFETISSGTSIFNSDGNVDKWYNNREESTTQNTFAIELLESINYNLNSDLIKETDAELTSSDTTLKTNNFYTETTPKLPDPRDNNERVLLTTDVAISETHEPAQSHESTSKNDDKTNRPLEQEVISSFDNGTNQPNQVNIITKQSIEENSDSSTITAEYEESDVEKYIIAPLSFVTENDESQTLEQIEGSGTATEVNLLTSMNTNALETVTDFKDLENSEWVKITQLLQKVDNNGTDRSVTGLNINLTDQKLKLSIEVSQDTSTAYTTELNIVTEKGDSRKEFTSNDKIYDAVTRLPNIIKQTTDATSTDNKSTKPEYFDLNAIETEANVGLDTLYNDTTKSILSQNHPEFVIEENLNDTEQNFDGVTFITEKIPEENGNDNNMSNASKLQEESKQEPSIGNEEKLLNVAEVTEAAMSAELTIQKEETRFSTTGPFTSATIDDTSTILDETTIRNIQENGIQFVNDLEIFKNEFSEEWVGESTTKNILENELLNIGTAEKDIIDEELNKNYTEGKPEITTQLFIEQDSLNNILYRINKKVKTKVVENQLSNDKERFKEQENFENIPEETLNAPELNFGNNYHLKEDGILTENIYKVGDHSTDNKQKKSKLEETLNISQEENNLNVQLLRKSNIKPILKTINETDTIEEYLDSKDEDLHNHSVVNNITRVPVLLPADTADENSRNKPFKISLSKYSNDKNALVKNHDSAEPLKHSTENILEIEEVFTNKPVDDIQAMVTITNESFKEISKRIFKQYIDVTTTTKLNKGLDSEAIYVETEEDYEENESEYNFRDTEYTQEHKKSILTESTRDPFAGTTPSDLENEMQNHNLQSFETTIESVTESSGGLLHTLWTGFKNTLTTFNKQVTSQLELTKTASNSDLKVVTTSYTDDNENVTLFDMKTTQRNLEENTEPSNLSSTAHVRRKSQNTEVKTELVTEMSAKPDVTVETLPVEHDLVDILAAEDEFNTHKQVNVTQIENENSFINHKTTTTESFEDSDYEYEQEPNSFEEDLGIPSLSNHNRHVPYVGVKIADQNYRHCLSGNFSLKMTLNDSSILVPENTRALGSCYNGGATLKITWNAQGSDENHYPNNTVNVNFKLTDKHFFIDAIGASIFIQDNAVIAHEFASTKEDLKLLETDIGERMHGNVTVSFENLIKLNITDISILLRVNSSNLDYSGGVTAKSTEELALMISGGCIALVVILGVIGFGLFKKYRNTPTTYKMTIE